MTLTLEHISKTFEKGNKESFGVLNDINLEVQEGEFLCILGPSGCGKTTLLRIIAGLEEQSEGHVLLNGSDIRERPHRLGMIFQDYSLFPWRTVEENIGFGLELKGEKTEVIETRVHEYLSWAGLTGFGKSRTYELSGGMRQRVAVVRALAVEPELLLMDEPFGALDTQTRSKLQSELVLISQETKKTILFVTHSVDEAVFLADRILVLSSRPSKIAEIIPVNLPRPRERTSLEYTHLRRHIIDLTHQQIPTQ